MLVEGYWKRRSITEALYFSLYKNMILLMVMILFGMGTQRILVDIYDCFDYQMYNIIYTLPMTFATGCFYTGFTREEILANPVLYSDQKHSVNKRLRRLALWLLTAFVNAVIIFGMTAMSFGDGDIATKDGRVLGSVDYGLLVFPIIVFTVNLKMVKIYELLLRN